MFSWGQNENEPECHDKAVALWAREGRGAKNTPTPTGISPGAAGT